MLIYSRTLTLGNRVCENNCLLVLYFYFTKIFREEAVLAKQREIEHKRIEAEVLKKESEKLLRRKEILDEKEAALVRKRNQVQKSCCFILVTLVY